MKNLVNIYADAIRSDMMQVESHLYERNRPLISLCDTIDNNVISIVKMHNDLNIIFNKALLKQMRMKNSKYAISKDYMSKAGGKMMLYHAIKNDMYKLYKRDIDRFNGVDLEGIIKESFAFIVNVLNTTKCLDLLTVIDIEGRLHLAHLFKEDKENTYTLNLQLKGISDDGNCLHGYNYAILLDEHGTVLDKHISEVARDKDCKYCHNTTDLDQCFSCDKCKKFVEPEQLLLYYLAIVQAFIDVEKKHYKDSEPCGRVMDKINSRDYASQYIKISDINKFKPSKDEDNVVVKNNNAPNKSNKESEKISKILSSFDSDFDL